MTSMFPQRIRKAVESYLSVRPVTLGGAGALLACYLRAVSARLMDRNDRRTVGNFLRHDLNLRVGGLLVLARAHTEDLGCYWKSHKPWMTAWFEPKANEVVVDVGANVGFWCLKAASLGAQVVAFEPNPGTFATLKQNAVGNHLTNLDVVNSALSSSLGSEELVTIDNRTGSSFLTAKDLIIDQSTGTTRHRVPTDTLDNALKARGIQHVDWLLVDVEGHELEVIRGAKVTLKSTRKLIVEVTLGQRETEVESYLSQAGFEAKAQGTADLSSNRYWLFANTSYY
jgi:FkbM family methyltransferase